MKNPTRIILLSTLICLMSNVALSQKSGRRASNKSTANMSNEPRTICKGEAVPKGFVIVSVKSSGKCGENSEMMIRKPADTEIVCDGSPVPPDYSVTRQESSTACLGASSNPLTNALFIKRDGSDSMAPKTSTSAPRDDDDEERPSRRTRVTVEVRSGGQSRQEKPKSVLEQRAEEEQEKALIKLAIINKEVVVGMTTEQVLESWGRPESVDSTTSSNYGRRETWRYRRGYQTARLEFKNGVLTEWWY